MAVFITGGHGHIGSWAAKYLIGEGEDVILFDTNPVVPDCLKPVADKLRFIQGSVMDFPQMADVFQRYRDDIDGIIHTVGVMGELVLENPHGNVNLNIAGTHNVLEIARQFEIPKVVYTSTGAVYGEVSGIIAEDAAPVNPSDLYGATKASCEFLGRQYAQTFGFDFRIARVYFCYGAGKLPSRFIRLYRLAFGALEGLSGLEMDRGADQQLDFVYVEDAGRGTALLYQAENPPAQHLQYRHRGPYHRGPHRRTGPALFALRCYRDAGAGRPDETLRGAGHHPCQGRTGIRTPVRRGGRHSPLRGLDAGAGVSAITAALVTPFRNAPQQQRSKRLRFPPCGALFRHRPAIAS